VIQRAFIHVAGPNGCGKTTFVEAVLATGDSPMVVGRCTRGDSQRRIRESSARRHPELQRYRRAGAWAAAAFAFARDDANLIDFYESRVMLEGIAQVCAAPLPHHPGQLIIGRSLSGSRASSAPAWSL
jgi:hypothetical protein